MHFYRNKNSRKKGEGRERRGEQNLILPSSLSPPSTFFPLSRPLHASPQPLFFSSMKSLSPLPSRVHARRKKYRLALSSGSTRIKMRGTLVLRTAFNVATHDETRGFIIYISLETKVDGRGYRKSGRAKDLAQQFFPSRMVSQMMFYLTFLFFPFLLEIKRI